MQGDTTISVTTKDKTYKLSFDENGSKNYTIIPGNNATGVTQDAIPHGGNYSFYVRPDDNAEAPTVELTTKENGTLHALDGGLYMLSDVTGNVTITITSGNKKQVNVLHMETAGITYYEEGGEKPLAASKSVEYGTPYTFVVKPDSGYEITGVFADNQPFLKAGIGELAVTQQGDDWTCTISKITKDTTITVNVRKKSYEVTIESGETGEGYSIGGYQKTVLVEAGSSYELYVSAKEGYGAPTVQYKEGKGDGGQFKDMLSTSTGVYRIPSVNDYITIKVTSGKKNQYRITFSLADGVTYKKQEGSQEINGYLDVEYQDNCEFKVELDEKYSQSKGSMKVLLDGIELKKSLESDSYIIKSVAGPHTVSVTGVSINLYQVTLPHQDEAYEITTTNTTNNIKHGDSFKFRIKVVDGWEIKSVQYKVNGGNGTPIKGPYNQELSIDSVEGNITVEITAEKKTVTVEFNTNESSTQHASIQSVDGGDFNLTGYHYGDTIRFKVKQELGYRLKQVDVNEIPCSPSGDGVYIAILTNDTIKIVATVETIKINISYSSTKYAGKLKDLKKQITIEDVSSGAVDLPGPNEGNKAAWNFQGWSSNDIEEFTDQKEITKRQVTTLLTGRTDDITINLTAKWINAFKDLIDSVKTNGSWSTQQAGKYTVTFKSTVAFNKTLEQLNQSLEEDDNITVDAVGIIYANKTFNTSDYETAIKTAVQLQRTSTPIGDNLNLYLTCLAGVTLKDIKPLDTGILDTINIMLEKVSSYPGARYASGWIQLSAGGESVLVYCNTPARVEGAGDTGNNDDGAIYK